jgi:hypothetical protein
MNLHDIPETARPNGETFVSMAEACERWPSAFAECLARLDGKVAHRASTALFPRTNGVPHLFLWADAPGHPDFEIAGAAQLPPDMAKVREMLVEVAH